MVVRQLRLMIMIVQRHRQRGGYDHSVAARGGRQGRGPPRVRLPVRPARPQPPPRARREQPEPPQYTPHLR